MFESGGGKALCGPTTRFSKRARSSRAPSGSGQERLRLWRETPHATPCRTSPPMPFLYTSRAKRPMQHHVRPHRRRVYGKLLYQDQGSGASASRANPIYKRDGIPAEARSILAKRENQNDRSVTARSGPGRELATAFRRRGLQSSSRPPWASCRRSRLVHAHAQSLLSRLNM